MTIYTDGSARPNPGKGGYGVIVLDNNEKIVYNYYREYEKTTNNEMELKAILYSFINFGVNIYDNEFADIPIVYTDSNYCLNTLTNWMFNWANNNWIKSDKKIPENLELIQAYYDRYQKGYRIDLRKVKGHDKNKWNNIVDELATGKITSKELYLKYGKSV